MTTLRTFFGRHSDMALVILVIGVLTVLFAPIPSPLLDFLILANFSFAFLILLLTRTLARALYASLEMDHYVPTEHYAAVARIMVWVLARQGARSTGPVPAGAAA